MNTKHITRTHNGEGVSVHPNIYYQHMPKKIQWNFILMVLSPDFNLGSDPSHLSYAKLKYNSVNFLTRNLEDFTKISTHRIKIGLIKNWRVVWNFNFYDIYCYMSGI